MEKFSDRNDKIITNIKKFFSGIKNWTKNNRKISISILIAIIICIVAIVAIRMFVTKGTNDTNVITETAQEVLGVEEEQIKEILEVPIEKDEYQELNLFFAEYFIALADGNKDVILKDRKEIDDLEWIKILKKSEFVESYQNIVCYTKPGPFDNSFVCYLYYEVKFHDLEVLVPGLSTMYVLQDEEEYFVEFTAIDDAVEDYLITISQQEDVVDLFRKVQVDYNDLVASDPEVELFLTELPDRIMVEVAKELALMNAEETLAEAEVVEPVEVDQEDAANATATDTTEVDEVVIETVKATTTVNVRQSDSTTAERIGKVQEGDELTRLESMNNGWSKIIYEDGEAYIKSEYLEVLESKTVEAGVSASGTIVTATDNVHIRKEASINSDNIGAALAGETFELVEAQDNGWSKIIFNGEEAYIKSEYLE